MDKSHFESPPGGAPVGPAPRLGARWIAAIACAVALAAPASAGAQADTDIGVPEDILEDENLYRCAEADGPISVSLRPEIDLEELITWAMSFSCRNFVYASGVGDRSAEVTVVAPERMHPGQAWRLFLVSLQSMGLTVVPKGNVLEVVEAPQASEHAIPLNLRGQADGREQVVRVVLRPEHLSADDLESVLGELTSSDGQILSVSDANIVVVTDYSSHIAQMVRLADEVDEAGHGEGLYMIPVQYAEASELAAKLEEILGEEDGQGEPRRERRRRRQRDDDDDASPARDAVAVAPTHIVPDERTNTLLLRASEPAYLRTRALVERLDMQLDVEGRGRINVHRLEHADAEELAQTLEQVISGIREADDDDGRRRRRGGDDEDARGPAFEGDVRVTHDAPTNSLVILASAQDFQALRDGVIDELDVRRPQVYIEAKVVEVSMDTSRDLGTSWHGGDALGDDGTLLLGGAQHSNLASTRPQTLLGATGILGGLLGSPLEGAEEILFGQSIPSFGVLFQALATASNVNLLSSPHILTLDNEEAEILVGENIPYLAGSFGTPFGGGQPGAGDLDDLGGGLGGLLPGTNVQRQDVALELALTPQISEADEVRLDIELEISDIASRDFEGLGPSWARRTIRDTVIVPDQQTIVIGGLMRDQITSSESKVPLLGDIPILGYLFKYTQKQTSKTNLLVTLTPYIVEDHRDIERIVERRAREQREFMRAYSDFDDVDYRPDVDYRRKRGLLAEISSRLDTVESERERLERFETRRIEPEAGPVEIQGDTSVWEGAGDDDADGAGDVEAEGGLDGVEVRRVEDDEEPDEAEEE